MSPISYFTWNRIMFRARSNSKRSPCTSSSSGVDVHRKAKISMRFHWRTGLFTLGERVRSQEKTPNRSKRGVYIKYVNNYKFMHEVCTLYAFYTQHIIYIWNVHAWIHKAWTIYTNLHCLILANVFWTNMHTNHLEWERSRPKGPRVYDLMSHKLLRDSSIRKGMKRGSFPLKSWWGLLSLLWCSQWYSRHIEPSELSETGCQG